MYSDLLLLFRSEETDNTGVVNEVAATGLSKAVATTITSLTPSAQTKLNLQ